MPEISNPDWQQNFIATSANMFSMAIVGPFVAYGVYHLVLQSGNQKVAIFLASTLEDLLTYVTTSIQLPLAFEVFALLQEVEQTQKLHPENQASTKMLEQLVTQIRQLLST